MNYRKITAIVNADCLAALEEALQREASIEVAITRIKGYGEYMNFYDLEWASTQARMEVSAELLHVPVSPRRSWVRRMPGRTPTASWRCFRWRRCTGSVNTSQTWTQDTRHQPTPGVGQMHRVFAVRPNPDLRIVDLPGVRASTSSSTVESSICRRERIEHSGQARRIQVPPDRNPGHSYGARLGNQHFFRLVQFHAQ